MIKNNLKIASAILSIVAFVSFAPEMAAQQDSQYTQYMYNTQTVNPAYVGSRGVFGITGLYRNQWVGLDGAPETLNVSLNTPVGSSERLGLGVSFVEDRIGPAEESTIAGDVSYSIPFKGGTELSFGVKGGINLLDVDYSKINILDPTDPLQQSNIDNRLTPIVGAGLYLHHQDVWYIGASVPNLLETTHYDDTTVSNASETANLYAMAGYVFGLGDNTKFKPAVLGKFVMGAPVALDVSANFMFYDKFTLGAAYRLDAAFSGLVGFQVTNGIFLGYAYDYGIQELANYNSGSHEVFLRFEFGNNKTDRFLSPRFF